MNEARYTVFTRTWWKHNPSWPNGLEPGVGKKTRIARNVSEAEARQICQQYNATHKPGRLSRKAEYEQQ
jgi:hypothetical protein